MSVTLKQISRAARHALRLAARPVRRSHEVGGLALQAYRGYGSRREALLRGRVLRQAPTRALRRGSGVRRDLVDIGKRLTRRGVAGATVRARFLGREQRVRSDADGYFEVHIAPREPPPSTRLWHRMELELVEPAMATRVSGQVFVPPPGARRVVISDIDDTVMETGVANKARMLWRLFVQGAGSRVAFPGVGELYKALHAGTGRERNPILYVSRGPWGLYDLLDEFFRLHHIPIGPILFLREWGISLRRPFPRRSRGHKLRLIRDMLALYDDLPVVLIGDSGQHDPEIYAQVVREHPGRVQAIYIRNVSRDAAREAAIAALAEETFAAGSPLLLAADSFAMARHAAEHGLIPGTALGRVLRARVRQQGHGDLQPTREVHGERIDPDALHDTLDRGARPPPNVTIEPRRKSRR